MSVTAASETDPEITSEQARDLMSARDRMLARHKLIEGMIRNNELQLRNESARGGAEIERACVLGEQARVQGVADHADAHDAVPGFHMAAGVSRPWSRRGRRA